MTNEVQQIDADTIECRFVFDDLHIGNIVCIGGRWHFAFMGDELLSEPALNSILNKVRALNAAE